MQADLDTRHTEERVSLAAECEMLRLQMERLSTGVQKDFGGDRVEESTDSDAGQSTPTASTVVEEEVEAVDDGPWESHFFGAVSVADLRRLRGDELTKLDGFLRMWLHSLLEYAKGAKCSRTTGATGQVIVERRLLGNLAAFKKQLERMLTLLNVRYDNITDTKSDSSIILGHRDYIEDLIGDSKRIEGLYAFCFRPTSTENWKATKFGELRQAVRIFLNLCYWRKIFSHKPAN